MRGAFESRVTGESIRLSLASHLVPLGTCAIVPTFLEIPATGLTMSAVRIGKGVQCEILLVPLSPMCSLDLKLGSAAE